MAITQAMCTTFKQEAMQGVHNLSAIGGDVFKLALYTSSANLSETTTVYTSVGEVTSGAGYTAGGNALTNLGVLYSGTIAYTSFGDLSFPSSTITAFGALIYNSTKANKAVAVINFGSNKSSLNSTFTVRFPPNNATSAIIRFD
jgi:hypothetical protein